MSKRRLLQRPVPLSDTPCPIEPPVPGLSMAASSGAPFEPARAAAQVPAAAAELSMLLSPHAGALESVRGARLLRCGAQLELRRCAAALVGGGGRGGRHARAAGRADCNAGHGAWARALPRSTARSSRDSQVSGDAAHQQTALAPAFSTITAGLARDFAYIDGVGVRCPGRLRHVRALTFLARFPGRSGERARGCPEDGGGAGGCRSCALQVRRAQW